MNIIELYKTKYKTLVKVAAWKVGPFWAEDIVQESFERMIKYNKGDIQDSEKYLSTIFRNVCNKYKLIASNRYHEVQEEDAIIECESPADWDMVTRDFDNLVKLRPKWHKEILEMTFILGMNEREVSDITGKSVASIWQVLNTFRKVALK